MENMKTCQSCAMPMSKPEDFGTETNGSVSQEYCCYCYQNGEFEGKDMTLEEMIESCAAIVVESGDAKNLDEARAALKEQLPGLKRWAKRN